MEIVYFKSKDEIVDKLKEMGVFTKTKTSKDLDKLRYKVKIDNVLQYYKCEVIAFSSKKNNKECINSYYESLTIRFNEKIININIDHFKDMQ